MSMKPSNLPVRVTESEWAERDRQFSLGYHWCSKCKLFLLLHEFNKSKTAKYGRTNWCKSCHNGSRKGHSLYKNKARQYNRQLKSYYKRLLGGKCAKCEYCKSQGGLDFHHVKPDEKQHTLAKLIGSNNHPLLMLEIDKCILLCKTCHAEFGSFVWTAEFEKVELGWIVKPGTITENENEYWEHVPDKILFEQGELLL